MFQGDAAAGHIRVEDLEKAIMAYGSEKLTAEQAHDLIRQVAFDNINFLSYLLKLEPDRNGYINFEQYVNMMMAK